MQEAASASLIQDTLLHSVNVLIHVLLGTAALALGVRQLAATKGDESHRRFGRWFLACIWGAVGTAAVGLLVFEFRAFLGVITLLVAYWAFAGYRTLRLRNHGPTLTDALGSVAGLGAAGLFVWTPGVGPVSLESQRHLLDAGNAGHGGDVRPLAVHVPPTMVRHALALRARREDDWRLQRDAFRLCWNRPWRTSALQPVAAFCCVHSDHDRLADALAPRRTGRSLKVRFERRYP